MSRAAWGVFAAAWLALPWCAGWAQEAAPSAHAKGEVYIGHRYFLAKGIGWGWIRKPDQPWKRALWAAIKENPDDGRVAPFRKLGRRDADHMHEYKLYGYWADYKAYDPKFNDLLPVFVIQGFEPLGPAKEPLKLKPGSRGQIAERPSRASSRSDRPITGQGDR